MNSLVGLLGSSVQTLHGLREEKLNGKGRSYMDQHLPNSEHLSNFWTSLPALMPKNGILTFQSIPDFLLERFKELYIRQSYIDLFSNHYRQPNMS